jgi:HK97 family phage major capsid protein
VPAKLAVIEEKENKEEITIKETIKMSDEIKEVPQVEPKKEVDVAALFAAFEAKMDSKFSEIVTAKSAPVVKRVTGKYSDNEQTDTFIHWVKSGDTVAAKAALQEDTTTEGGYLVPDDFLGRIIAKRDEMSIMRQMGAQIIPTSRDVVNVPTENAAVSPARVAEEGATNESEPTFAQVAIEVHKVDNLIKVSEELMADEAANLMGFLSNHVARQFAAWENDAFFVGTGSNEPDGVFQSGTAAITSDYATSIATSEIPELYFKLAGEYRDTPSCYWAMKDSTLGLIQGLTGSNFQFVGTPAGGIMQLWNKPVKTSSRIAAHTAGLKSIVFGDFNYYAIVERAGLSVFRNPYLYAGNGQIGLTWKQRVGGAVLQAEAFQYMTAHA